MAEENVEKQEQGGAWIDYISFGENKERDVTSSTYERSQKRLKKDVENFLGIKTKK